MSENQPKNSNFVATFIWLDDTIETKNASIETKKRLQQISKNCLTTFTDPDECVDHISTVTTTEKLFFIVSNKFGHYLVPLIYDMPEIHKIYVYCGNKALAESWAKNNPKVCGIFTKNQELLQQIRQDVRACNLKENAPMTIFHLEDKQRTIQSITQDSVKFLWYQTILTVLGLMAIHGNAKADMIKECRAKYHDNDAQLNKIKDFDDTYTSEKVFKWYTADSFAYKILNEALRTQHIEIIFQFRFFINHLQNQIQQLYNKYLASGHSEVKNGLTVYRGQRMAMNELKILQDNENELISMNSFWSVTRNPEVAKMYTGKNDETNKPDALQAILFHIKIRNISEDTTPFAVIEDYACIPDEEEILFTINAIFKIGSIEKNEKESIWDVHLELTKPRNEDCRGVFDHMKKQIGSEPSPSSFGWFLFRKGDFDMAERYVNLILTKLPPNDKETGNAYNLLGLIYKDLKDPQKAVEYYEKALEIYSQPQYQNSPNRVIIYYNLGLAYLALGDDRSADEHRIKAGNSLASCPEMDNPLFVAMTDNLKAQIKRYHGDYQRAYELLKEVLERKKASLPPDHPSIASTLKELGIVEEKRNNNKEAIGYFEKALEISYKCLPADHSDFPEYYTNIGRIYYKLQEYKAAMEQFEKALKCISEEAARAGVVDLRTLVGCMEETKQKLGNTPT